MSAEESKSEVSMRILTEGAGTGADEEPGVQEVASEDPFKKRLGTITVEGG